MAEEIGRKTIELAKGGDSRALKPVSTGFCLRGAIVSCLSASRRSNSAGDLPKASGALLAAVAEGEITPAEAAELARLVETHAKAIEVNEIEARLAELEDRMES